MKDNFKCRDSKLELTLPQQVDLQCLQELHNELIQFVPDITALRVNASDLSEVDVSGIQWLSLLNVWAKERNITFELCNLSTHAQEIFRTFGLPGLQVSEGSHECSQ